MDPKTPDQPSQEPNLDTPAAEVSSGADTVEGVEEFWRKRMAGKERAWNAAEEVLRGQIGTLQQAASRQGSGQTAGQDEISQQLADAQRELQTERGLRVIEQRKAKYPDLAKQGYDDTLFAVSDEATLAKLNALAEDTNGGGTFIAPTTPKRPDNGAAKRPEDMTLEELKGQFKVAADAYDQSRQR